MGVHTPSTGRGKPMTKLLIPVLLLIIAANVSFHPTAAAPSQDSFSSKEIVVKGDVSLFQLRFDLCSQFLLLGSCPIGMSLAEHYMQPAAIDISAPIELQPLASDSTRISVTPGSPNLSLNFIFTYGSHSYPYSVPLLSMKALGKFTYTVPLSQILPDLIGLGLPSVLASKLISLNMPISLVSSLRSDVAQTGFVTTQQRLEWKDGPNVWYNTTLSGAVEDSHIELVGFQTIFLVNAKLVFSVPVLPPVTFFSVDQDIVSFGSSEVLLLGHWYHLAVASAQSQPLGSGWFLSGSTATISVKDHTLSNSGVDYTFAGWAGSGNGSYSGSTASPSLVVNGPIQETAVWQSSPAQSAPLVSADALITISVGIVVAGLLIAGAVALLRRRNGEL
jgi:hypothetical protein